MAASTLFSVVESDDACQLNTLIASGVELNVVDDFGVPLLLNAVESGSVECVKLLLASTKVNIDMRDEGKRTALHFACKENNAQMVVLLLENSAKFDVKDTDECNIFHYMAKHGASGSVTSIAQSHPQECATVVFAKCKPISDLINATDCHQWTPLHYAYANRKKAMVTILLKEGANPSAVDKHNRKPIDIAREKDYFELL